MNDRMISRRLVLIKTWTCMAFAILMGVFVLLQYNNRSIVVVEGADGVWDLTSVHFDSHSVHLTGPVAYVPNALLTPEEFNASSDVVIGAIPEQCNFLTSRIRLIVPDGQYYEFSGFSDGYGSRLYVNGEWRLDVGKPADTKEENIATEDYVLITVRPSDGVVEIVQQASNFVFRKNNPHNAWTIGHEETTKKWTATLYSIHAINTGLYLTLFLVNLLLYGFIVNHKAMLWLGLLSLDWAIRLGVTGMRPLLTLVSWLNWPVTFRMEYCTAVAAVVLITLCIDEQFPGVLPKSLRIMVIISQSIFALSFMLCDTLFVSKSLHLCAFTGIFFAIWTAIRLLRSHAHRNGMRQKLTLVGLGIIALGVILDTGYFVDISTHDIVGGSMETAVFIFSIFQLAATLLLTEEGIIRTQETKAKLVLENASLDRTSKLRADMMATFSHEMRTPLAVMMGFAQLTASELRDTNASKQAIRDLDAISDEARRMKQLVDEMQELSLTRMAREEMRPLDIEPIVSQLCRMYEPIAARKDTMLVLDIDDNLPLVSVTADGLTQVLFNLLNNADRHTNGGEIHVCATSRAEGIHLVISDTGDGIDPEQIPHVFERYSKGEGGGLGMGLTICKDLVESWGGDIFIESKLGVGTTVNIILFV